MCNDLRERAPVAFPCVKMQHACAVYAEDDETDVCLAVDSVAQPIPTILSRLECIPWNILCFVVEEKAVMCMQGMRACDARCARDSLRACDATYLTMCGGRWHSVVPVGTRSNKSAGIHDDFHRLNWCLCFVPAIKTAQGQFRNPCSSMDVMDGRDLVLSRLCLCIGQSGSHGRLILGQTVINRNGF